MRLRTPASLVLGTLALVAAAPAMAQDTDDKNDWTGFYVGGSFGMGVQSNNNGETIQFDTNRDGTYGDAVNTAAGANAFAPGFCRGTANGATPAAGCTKNKDGIEYFGRVGYDRQMGNFVVGVMGEFGKSEVRDSVSAFSTTPASYTLSRELDWQANVRARAGYAQNGALFYVAGGPSYAKIDHSLTTTNGVNSFTSFGDSNAWGWNAGGGVEVKATRNISLGLEYMYSRLNDKDNGFTAGPGTAPATNPFLIVDPTGTDLRRSDNRFDRHGLRATAAFRF